MDNKIFIELYEKLSAPIKDKNAIQRTSAGQTKKGYDTTGFGYQFLVNRFNEVLGIGGWNWSFKEIERQTGNYKTSGQQFYSIAGEATISIIWEGKELVKHSEYGGHKSALLEDALKGASTNAFKKTAAFFGVGKDAFEGSIDEDNKAPDVKTGMAYKNVKTVGKVDENVYQLALKAIQKEDDVIALEQVKTNIESSSIYTKIQKDNLLTAINAKIKKATD
jgi:hypothetical protein